MKSALALILVACCTAVLAHKPMSQELIDFVNNQPESTWTAGHNARFDGVPLSTIKKMMGLLPNHKEHMPKHIKKHSARSMKDVPAEFDARTQWPNCPSIAEIRDQGACGSCWALAAVEAMTDRICIASNATKMPHISAEDLNSCCGSSCGFGCNGGFSGGAWDFWAKTGLVTGGNFNTTEGCLPYTVASCDHHVVGHLQPCGNVVPTPKCQKTCEPSYSVSYDADKQKGKTSYSVDSKPASIQAEILKNGPVEAGYTVYADFLSYKTGVYKHTTGAELGLHAVKIMGWGTDSGSDYWLVANSWNTDWGDNGIFKILRGKNECGIEDSIVAGLPPSA